MTWRERIRWIFFDPNYVPPEPDPLMAEFERGTWPMSFLVNFVMLWIQIGGLLFRLTS